MKDAHSFNKLVKANHIILLGVKHLKYLVRVGTRQSKASHTVNAENI